MKTQADKPSYFNHAGTARGVLLLLIAGIAVILFSTAGIARMMGWGPNSTGDSGDILALDQTAPVPTASEARAKPRCPECGMIVSTREIDARGEGASLDASGGVVARNQGEPRMTSARRYEMTIRLADGSSRVINHASPARWRPGERVIVIDGANPSNR